MTSFIAAGGSGRSISVIPAIPAPRSVTTIAFIAGTSSVSLLAVMLWTIVFDRRLSAGPGAADDPPAPPRARSPARQGRAATSREVPTARDAAGGRSERRRPPAVGAPPRYRGPAAKAPDPAVAGGRCPRPRSGRCRREKPAPGCRVDRTPDTPPDPARHGKSAGCAPDRRAGSGFCCRGRPSAKHAPPKLTEVFNAAVVGF